MSPATETKTIVAPWGIEADHPRNADLMLQCIPGCRLRGAVSAMKTTINKKTGEATVPRDQAIHLGQFPPVPGMQLHVNPAKLTYQVIDPLHDDEALCERLRLAIERSSPYRAGRKLEGVPPQKGTLDVHRMKTLCREMLNLLKANEAKMVRGTEPKLEDIEKLPGKFLLNPGSRIHNAQPRYEEDYEEWENNLTRHGG